MIIITEYLKVSSLLFRIIIVLFYYLIITKIDKTSNMPAQTSMLRKYRFRHRWFSASSTRLVYWAKFNDSL